MYMRNEFIPLLFAQNFLQVVKKDEAFLVRNAGKGVLGVFTIEVVDQFCELMGLSILSNRL